MTDRRDKQLRGLCYSEHSDVLVPRSSKVRESCVNPFKINRRGNPSEQHVKDHTERGIDEQSIADSKSPIWSS